MATRDKDSKPTGFNQETGNEGEISRASSRPPRSSRRSKKPLSRHGSLSSGLSVSGVSNNTELTQHSYGQGTEVIGARSRASSRASRSSRRSKKARSRHGSFTSGLSVSGVSNNTELIQLSYGQGTEVIGARSRASSRTSHTSRKSYKSHSRRDSTSSIKTNFLNFFGFGNDKKKLAVENSELINLLKEADLANSDLRSKLIEAELQNYKLRTRLTETTLEHEETCKGLKNILHIYNNKLGKLDQEFGNSDSQIINVQIGDNNTMIVEETNDVLVAFHEAISESVKTIVESNASLTEKSVKIRAMDDEIKQLNSENDRLTSLVRSLEIEREKFQEVVESLRDIQGNMEIRDKTRSLKLDYTLSLTDSTLMEKSINDLREMTEDNARPYNFRDISNNAKFGVMRILRKYCQKDPKLTVNEFAESLGVDVHLKSDCELEEDTCTDILTRWTKQSTDHTVDVLVKQYPRLNRYGSVRGNLGSEAIDGSVSMLDISGTARFSEVLRQEFMGLYTKHKQTHDLLNDIKSSMQTPD